MRHYKFKSRCAESLIETIIAITVIIIGSSAAIGITHSALKGNESIGYKMVAMNLAEEGIEAVKNIRDTNYLRFASAPDTCWKTLRATTAATVTNCSTSVISDGTYYLTRDLSTNLFAWGMATGTTKIEIWTYTLDTTPHQIYAQKSASCTGCTSSATIYSRKLTVANTDTNSFDLTVTVTWTEAGISKTLSLTRTISNVY